MVVGSYLASVVRPVGAAVCKQLGFSVAMEAGGLSSVAVHVHTGSRYAGSLNLLEPTKNQENNIWA